MRPTCSKRHSDGRRAAGNDRGRATDPALSGKAREVRLDLARPDGRDAETERLAGIPLAAFGLTGPADIPCLSLRFHIAQKLHGMTKAPHDGSENDRFRDAVDLFLLRQLVSDDDLFHVREACEETFRVRAQHTWPPVINLPAAWRDPFARLAASVALETTELTDAERQLQAFVDQIVRATSTVPGPDA